MGRYETYLKALNVNIFKKAKQNLEWDSKVGGRIIFFSIANHVNYLSREGFRNALWWRLDITLQDNPLACN